MTDEAEQIAAFERLAALVGYLRAGAVAPPDVALPIADAISAFVDGQERDVGKALKVSNRQSFRDFRTKRKIEIGDEILREAARRFYSAENKSNAAKGMASEILRYHGTGWKGDQSADQCPEHRIGTKQEFCWRYLKLFERVLGWERIRQILGTSNP